MSEQVSTPQYNGESFSVFCENNDIEKEDIFAIELFSKALSSYRNSLGIIERSQDNPHEYKERLQGEQ